MIQFSFLQEGCKCLICFWFSDAQWERIAPLLPDNTRGLKRVDDRRVLSGIVHALKSGGALE